MRRLPIALVLAACNTAQGPSETESPPLTTDAACGEDLQVFTEQVWDPVLSRTCTSCHVEGGFARDSAFILDPQDIEASMIAAIGVADRIADKPLGEDHGGGAVIGRDSSEHEALQFWKGWVIDGQCDLPATCGEEPGRRLLRRLTHTEYNATVADLLYTTTTPADAFAPDNIVDGFPNDADGLVVSDLLVGQLAEAAEQLAEEADLERLQPCDPYVDGFSTCAVLFIEDFGFRAFRRPLTQDDIDRYYGLWEAIAVEDGGDSATRWVIAAMLQSPHFLYRSELGERDAAGDFVLTDWELASALSYTLLGTMPDTELFEAAENGSLSSSDGLADQVSRLLADPRATHRAIDLVEVWLHLDRLETVSRAGLTPELRVTMRDELRALVQDVATADGDLDDLLAQGLLTERAVLTTHGRHVGSSPVQRGVMVRERLLCEELPPPPVNVDASPPELDPDSSTRDLYIQHSADPECAGCHEKIDPIGFGFEHYDELGQWRDLDGVHTIDDSGHIDGTPFEGTDELAVVLGDDARFRACFVETWRRFASGTEACADDPGGVGLLDPLADLPFRLGFSTRSGEADSGDTLARGQRITPELPEEIDPPSDLEITETKDDWGSGYCNDVALRNPGTEAVTWSITLLPDGTIGSLWGANVEETDAGWTFTGVDYNAELAPGASTQAALGSSTR